MLRLFTLFVFAQSALSLAPYNHQLNTVDRLDERSYIVVLKETVSYASSDVQAWLRNEIPGANLSNVRHVYNMGSFRGFSIWLSKLGLFTVRQSRFVKYVDANGYASILPIQNQPVTWSTNVSATETPFLTRPDWGQVRAGQLDRDLTTDPVDEYANGKYADANADTWNWNGPTFTPINDGSLADIWILDTGVLVNHQEFLTSDGKTSRVKEAKNIINDTPPPLGDCNGHGTHCAGSAAGLNRGVAKNADIRSVRVLSCSGSGTWDDVIAGVQYIHDNPTPDRTNILSASLGGGKILSVNAAFDQAAQGGIIPIVAAGNSKADAANYSPASAAGVITVGASDGSDAIAYFSSWGTKLNCFAPGVNIHSAYTGSPSAYATLSGTSMATPLVAGSVALLGTRENRVLKFAEVVLAINQTSTLGKVTGLQTKGAGDTTNAFINSKWEK